ncbi:MAG: hypothetical protein AAF512_07850, partial [Pseudomonadota bacterium]
SSLPAADDGQTLTLRWTHHEGGLHRVGFEGEGFHFDNEGPSHEVVKMTFDSNYSAYLSQSLRVCKGLKLCGFVRETFF